MLRVIDTHAHLEEVDGLDGVLHEAAREGVAAVVAVGMSYESNLRVLEISERHPGMVYPALGLHPWELERMDSSDVERTLQQIEDNLAAIVAVGEVGLDYDKRVRALADKDRQQAILRQVLEIARRHDKPALVHSRYAWRDAVTVARSTKVGKVVFHWYTGPSSVLRDIVAGGYFISATPASEYHAEHRRAVGDVPLANLLLETDSPVRYGRDAKYTSTPRDVLRSLRAVSEVRGLEETVVAEATTANAERLFDFTVGRATG